MMCVCSTGLMLNQNIRAGEKWSSKDAGLAHSFAPSTSVGTVNRWG